MECYGNFFGNCCVGVVVKWSNVLFVFILKDGMNVVFCGFVVGVFFVCFCYFCYVWFE